MSLNQLQVQSPTSAPDGSTQTAIAGKASETMGAMLHGKWYTNAYRGNNYSFAVAAVTLPVNANNLISVYTIVNPASTGKNMELICADTGITAAATLVDVIGLYYQSGSVAVAGLGTLTAGTILSGIVGGSATGVGIGYTAATHTGTPTRYCILNYFGATTTTNAVPGHLEFDGRAIAPPNTVLCVAASTTVWGGATFAVSLAWSEIPV